MLNNQSISTKKTATKAFSKVFGSVAAYSLISIAIVYLIQIVTAMIVGGDGLIALSENIYFIWGTQIVSMYLIAFPLLLLFVRKLPSANRTAGDMSLKEFFYIFLVSEAVMLIGAIISNWLTAVMGNLLGHEIANTTSELIEKTPIGVIILVVVIIGPIVEEMIFRKIMIDKLSIYGDRLAIIVSAIAFGIFHGNFYQLIYATALGLVLGYVYTKTRRSIYNCLLHMAINFMGTIPSLLTMDAVERLQALPEDAMLEGSLINDYYLVMGVSTLQYILAGAGVWIFIKATKDGSYRVPSGRDELLLPGDYPRVCFFNLGVIAFLIVGIGQCILSLFVS